VPSRKRTKPRQPRAPVQARSEATVAAIVRASAQVIVRDGFDGTTTNKIAARAGVSVGTLYHYFPDKASIYDALVARAIDDTVRHVVDRSRALLAGSGATQPTFRALVEMAIAWVRTNEVVARAVLEHLPSTRQRALFRTVEERVISGLGGELATDVPSVQLFVTMGAAAIHRIALDRPDAAIEAAMIDALVRTATVAIVGAPRAEVDTST